MSSRSALDLLNDYGSESSEEEIPGPRVSTKRIFRDEDDNPKKRLERLPVPQEFVHNMKCEEHVDSPTLHDGRIRSFSHERGNWATFIYIPLQVKTGITKLLSYVEEVMPKNLAIKLSDDFHLSLTRTVVLKYHWIPSFVKTIKDNVEHFEKFLVLFDHIKVYCNEERTRTFLGMRIKSGHDSLLRLVKTLDRCLDEYKLPPFYNDPSFHISIAWCVGDKEEELQNYISQINVELDNLMQQYTQENWYIFVECLMCKIGNKYFQFMLS